MTKCSIFYVYNTSSMSCENKTAVSFCYYSNLAFVFVIFVLNNNLLQILRNKKSSCLLNNQTTIEFHQQFKPPKGLQTIKVFPSTNINNNFRNCQFIAIINHNGNTIIIVNFDIVYGTCCIIFYSLLAEFFT